MLDKNKSKGLAAIVITFSLAMLMDAMPWPDSLNIFKPEWVTLVLIYWVMALPTRIGIFSGWFVGLFVDVLDGVLFGINAFSLSIVAYLTLMIYHRLRLYPKWKQAANVAVLVGIHRLIVMNLSGIIEPVNVSFTYWLPLLGSAILWPWVFILLRDTRRNFIKNW